MNSDVSIPDDHIPGPAPAHRGSGEGGRDSVRSVSKPASMNMRQLGLWMTIMMVFCIHYVTQPATECPGDGEYTRIEAVTLINQGKWQVPAEIASHTGDPGQYYYYNRSSGIWYSKYGIMSTLLYVPPLLLEKWALGGLPYESTLRVRDLNVYLMLFTMAAAAYLYLLAGCFTRYALNSMLFVLACLYATFWWNHTRIQAFEAFTPLFLTGGIFHVLRAASRDSGKHFVISAAFLGILMLCKTVYIIVPPLLMLVILANEWLQSACDFRSERFRRCLLRMFFCYMVPIAGFVLILLATNWIKFGSPFNLGYSSWAKEAHFMDGNILDGIFGYFLNPQYNIFITFPVVAVALFGWRRFLNSFPLASAIILLTGLVLLCVNAKFVNWAGEWSYGPRYLIPILPLLSLPFVTVLDGIRESLKAGTPAAFAAAGVILLLLAASVEMQMQINALPFFAIYDLKGALISPLRDGGLDYSFSTRPFPLIAGDLLKFREGIVPPWYSEVLKRYKPDLHPVVDAVMRRLTASNYLFLK